MRNNRDSLYGAGDFYDTDPFPEDGETAKPRKRAVRLDDIDNGNGDRGGSANGDRGRTDRGGRSGPFGGRSGQFGGKSGKFDGKSGKFGRRSGYFGAQNGSDSANDAVICGKTAQREECYRGDGQGDVRCGKAASDKTATAYAMTLVSSQALTERALRDKLIRREYSESEIEDAVSYVKGFGYVNDQRLAEAMLDKLAARHYGRFKICRYLASKGIDGDVIEGLDFSEIDFPRYCAELIRKYPPERRDAMLRAVKNAGYSLSDYKAALGIIADEK